MMTGRHRRNYARMFPQIAHLEVEEVRRLMMRWREFLCPIEARFDGWRDG